MVCESSTDSSLSQTHRMWVRAHACVCASACACIRDSIFHPLVQGLFVHAARTARAGMNKLVMDTHTYKPAHGAYLYTCLSWGLARSLKNALQSGSIKIGLFNILDTALIHAHTLAGVQRWLKKKKLCKCSQGPLCDVIKTLLDPGWYRSKGG